ncbi:SPOR domain-containing protein [Desulfurobacterium atlanticum]|uniref:Sporulation related domain-containing protein n=1 Tax=Desulfurobacterium atlanticum TaxID=240169 RepID=A0A238YNP6_9BACT|nr:SPOR domain-containing protein [Desulfurobacterium atlanticum]SNR72765.1 Sporulation related domain-containing protein [Desulfurobacterium atlanticum]
MNIRGKGFAFFIITFYILLTIIRPSLATAKETPYYTIQLANTKSFNEAKSIFEKVKHLKDSRIDKVKTRYKVRVGLFKTRKEAQEFLKNHPEIKKISPTAYITLNYYNPKRTILKGYSKKKDIAKEAAKINTENKTKKEVPPVKIKTPAKQNTISINNTTLQKNHRESNYIEIRIKKELFKTAGLLVIGLILGLILFLIRKKLTKKEKELPEDNKKPKENTPSIIFHKLRDSYYSFLKRLPLKTSHKIVEYHYRKSGDFRSLILLKLQEQDFNFILKETPSYLLKNPDDILVWKIYIEVLGQLGIYDEAANACEKLAEILKKNARPEAAENYTKKAQEYRQKALKLAENL